ITYTIIDGNYGAKWTNKVVSPRKVQDGEFISPRSDPLHIKDGPMTWARANKLK
ncbi:unnamed protein product, partial [Dovyalis caffra]